MKKRKPTVEYEYTNAVDLKVGDVFSHSEHGCDYIVVAVPAVESKRHDASAILDHVGLNGEKFHPQNGDPIAFGLNDGHSVIRRRRATPEEMARFCPEAPAAVPPEDSWVTFVRRR